MSLKIFNNWAVRNIILIFVFIGVLALCASLFLNMVTQHGRVHTVPDFTSMTVGEAAVAAANSHMKVEVVDSVYVNRQPKGTVVRQVPSPGASVKSGRRICLTINAVQSRKVPMPNLVGYSLRSAKAEILARGLQMGRLIYVNDIATNNVLKQIYGNYEIAPGEMVPGDSKIDLMLGLDSENCTTDVPSLMGVKYSTAIDRIYDHSLNVGYVAFGRNVRTYQDSLNATVSSQTPAPGEIMTMGNAVSIRLSLDGD